jgi:hypothetical protein
MDQQPPQGDARYRVHRSVRCYIAELRFGTVGASWSFDESAERKVYLDPAGREFVVYKTRYYPLQPAARMIEIVKTHSRLQGGVVTVGNKAIYWDGEDREFAPYPFIDLTSQAEHARFRQLLASKAAVP